MKAQGAKPDVVIWHVIRDGLIMTIDGWKTPAELWPCIEIGTYTNMEDAQQIALMCKGDAVRANDLRLVNGSKENTHVGESAYGEATGELPKGTYQTNPGTRRNVQ